MSVKRRLLTIIISALLISVQCFPVNAAGLELPDGGSSRNSGVAHVYGRSSGGEDGYINVDCKIDIIHGATGINDLFNSSTDEAVATLTTDVIGNMSVYISCTVYYTTTSGSEDVNELDYTDYMTSNVFSVVAVANNDYAHKGTAGYSIGTENRGRWVCGTTIEI